LILGSSGEHLAPVQSQALAGLAAKEVFGQVRQGHLIECNRDVSPVNWARQCMDC
jgi:hypothetical protein